MTNTCGIIVSKLFSTSVISSGQGTQYEGAMVGFAHSLTSHSDLTEGLSEAFFRQHAPNLMNVVGTIMVFAIVIYLQVPT